MSETAATAEVKKDAAAPVMPEVVEPAKDAAAEPVVTTGLSLEIFKEGASHFVPALQKDMPLAERKVAVREVIRQSIQIDDKLQLVNGEMLYEVSKNKYWNEWEFADPKTGETRKFASFDEYCEVELDMKRRKAYYLMSIYEKYVVELKLPNDILKDMEWSKAKELVSVITEDNWPDLIDKIGKMSVPEVKELVRTMKAAGTDGTSGATTPAEPDTTVRMAFKLHPDQAENVKAALAIAESMSGSDKPGNQLDLICSDFLASAVGSGVEGALAKLEVVIKNVERAFGVTLELKGVDEARYAKLGTGESKEKKAEAELEAAMAAAEAAPAKA